MAAEPAGETPPNDGTLPAQAAIGATARDFGIYLHVPYCQVRCSYCDFNTYLLGTGAASTRPTYIDSLKKELILAANTLEQAKIPARPVATVFFGGGTPTLLRSAELGDALTFIRNTFGLKPDAEVTVEANPDTLDRDYIEALATAGFTRVSMGMQSANQKVLDVLGRTHNPLRLPQLAEIIHETPMQLSFDLIYGTPGETLADWRHTVTETLAMRPDHISAYALIVEPATKLARQISHGYLKQPDDDLQAEMYELADTLFESAGFTWYEISNWSTNRQTRSRHNLAYWLGHDWWGAGPGAHSHIGGVRWWNQKHPLAWADKLKAGLSPVKGRETLDDTARHEERVLLETRISDGLPVAALKPVELSRVPALVKEGLLQETAFKQGHIKPTRQGRLLADTLIHRLLGNSAC